MDVQRGSARIKAGEVRAGDEYAGRVVADVRLEGDRAVLRFTTASVLVTSASTILHVRRSAEDFARLSSS